MSVRTVLQLTGRLRRVGMKITTVNKLHLLVASAEAVKIIVAPVTGNASVGTAQVEANNKLHMTQHRNRDSRRASPMSGFS